MKKNFLSLLTVTAISASALVQADVAQNKDSSGRRMQGYDHYQCWEGNNRVRVGASWSYLWITPKSFSSFHGNLWGAEAVYEYRPLRSIYQGLTFNYRQGNTHSHSQKRELLDFDVQERLGYTFANAKRNWAVTLYAGFGYRYLGQELKQPSLSTVSFDYSEFYVPIGFLVNRCINKYVDIGVNFSWLPQAFTTVDIIPLGGANWIIKRRIDNLQAELPITFKPMPERSFIIELKPYVQWWHDGKSVARTSFGDALGLPSNTYLFAGIELNLGAQF
jgi:hypothetical protein